MQEMRIVKGKLGKPRTWFFTSFTLGKMCVTHHWLAWSMDTFLLLHNCPVASSPKSCSQFFSLENNSAGVR